jgi:DNA-binding CsgD family transcriptional regulator
VLDRSSKATAASRAIGIALAARIVSCTDRARCRSRHGRTRARASTRWLLTAPNISSTRSRRRRSRASRSSTSEPAHPRLDRTGVRRGVGEVGSRRSSQRASLGWNSLTDAERGLAELVGLGMTNKELAVELFLSRHTVDSHLRHIYRKLDINSQVELARLVALARDGTRTGPPPIAKARRTEAALTNPTPVTVGRSERPTMMHATSACAGRRGPTRHRAMNVGEWDPSSDGADAPPTLTGPDIESGRRESNPRSQLGNRAESYVGERRRTIAAGHSVRPYKHERRRTSTTADLSRTRIACDRTQDAGSGCRFAPLFESRSARHGPRCQSLRGWRAARSGVSLRGEVRW